MNQKLVNQYDSYYSSGDKIFRSGPVPIVKNLSQYLHSGKVLDVGGGEGRNALYLTEKGFDVTVVDFSAVALAKLNNEAREKGLHISTLEADIQDLELHETYDAIVSSFVLFHLSEAGARRVIEATKHHTSPGGVHVHATFANQGELYERNKGKEKFYPSVDTLKELYGDWSIKELNVYETTCHARRKDGSNMKNDVVAMIAVKN